MSEEKVFKCPFCGAEYPTLEFLNIHAPNCAHKDNPIVKEDEPAKQGADPANEGATNEENQASEGVDLDKMNVEELKAEAKRLGVTGYSSMKKEEIIAAILAANLLAEGA